MTTIRVLQTSPGAVKAKISTQKTTVKINQQQLITKAVIKNATQKVIAKISQPRIVAKITLGGSSAPSNSYFPGGW